VAELATLRDRATSIAEALRVVDPEWQCSWTPADVLGLGVAAGSVRQGGFLLEVGAGFSTGILASSLPHYDCHMLSVDVSNVACNLALSLDIRTIRCADIRSVFSNGWPIDELLSPMWHDIDVLVIDGEHIRDFALWYIEHLWPAVRNGGQIVIHDMHDSPRSRGEFETVMGELWARGWKYMRTAHDKPSVGAWGEVPYSAPGVRNCLLTVAKP